MKNRPLIKLLISVSSAALMICFALILLSPSFTTSPLPEPPPEPVVITPSPAPSPKPTPTPTPEPSPTPEPEPTPEFFTLTMIGDITPSATLNNKGISAAYGNVVGEDYAYPFSETLEYFKNSDFTIANFECVLTEHDIPQSKNFVFKAPPKYVYILTEGGVDFVTLGNNHVLDYGERGYADTKKILDIAGIGYAGRDEWALYETENGLLIGVYALSFGYTEQIKAGITALKEAGAEFIIAAIHWGDEGSYKANDLQRTQGRAAVDAGADIVYGTHPHTLQPIEEYNGKYIYYSMGNWSFGGNTNPRDKDTFILRLTVMRDIDGTISITDREHIPCASSGDKNRNDYRPVVYEEGSEEWLRTLSKLDGTYGGSDLFISYEYDFSEF
ncbi:MAG: CapA family protein [Oscillospiraceae bacterium]|nr:CapA family protein [Oscillospiraceae bacterium]